MKITIFYFSGSGNSLAIARNLGKTMGGAEIVPISKVMNSGLDLSADKIGIVFPVYMFGLPVIIAEFLKKLKNLGDKYIFAIANCGGAKGFSLKQAETILRAGGSNLSAGFEVIMPGNYTPLYGAKSEEKQKKLFAGTDIKIKEIAGMVNNNQQTKISGGIFPLNLLSKFFYSLSAPKIPKMSSKFWASPKCNGCGICSKVCPVKNIEHIENKPKWLLKCEQCLACLHWCPKEAIEYGNKTAGKKRYRHPEINLNDMLAR